MVRGPQCWVVVQIERLLAIGEVGGEGACGSREGYVTRPPKYSD